MPEDAESRSVVVTIGGPTQASSVAASRAPPSVPDDPELPDELDEELEPPDDPEEPEEEPEEPEEEPDEEPELPEELDEPVFPDDVPEPSASSSSAPRAHPAADARDAERAKARSKREGTILRCYARIWDFFPQCQNAPRPGKHGAWRCHPDGWRRRATGRAPRGKTPLRQPVPEPVRRVARGRPRHAENAVYARMVRSSQVGPS